VARAAAGSIQANEEAQAPTTIALAAYEILRCRLSLFPGVFYSPLKEPLYSGDKNMSLPLFSDGKRSVGCKEMTNISATALHEMTANRRRCVSF